MVGKAAGFTLLELLVVIAIAAIMLALVPPLISGSGSATELRGAARQLAAGLKLARNQAASKRQPAALTVDVKERQFTVAGRTLALPDADAVEIKLYTASEELIDEDRGNIRFFPDGSSTGGHVTLAGKRSEYRVNVDWLTGRVDIEEQEVQQ